MEHLVDAPCALGRGDRRARVALGHAHLERGGHLLRDVVREALDLAEPGEVAVVIGKRVVGNNHRAESSRNGWLTPTNAP